jgi:hypothetical protein
MPGLSLRFGVCFYELIGIAYEAKEGRGGPSNGIREIFGLSMTRGSWRLSFRTTMLRIAVFFGAALWHLKKAGSDCLDNLLVQSSPRVR